MAGPTSPTPRSPSNTTAPAAGRGESR
jgi:hypothetical protein